MGGVIDFKVSSEVAKLKAVVVHFPGQEVEDMTPEYAEKALYSDILNLAVAGREYNQFHKTLKRFAEVLEVKDLLRDILEKEGPRNNLLRKVCENEGAQCELDYLVGLSAEELARQLIEGVPLKRDTLSNFLSKRKHALRPLHNFFYTRDSAVTIGNEALISRMRSNIREREAIIMEAIFDHHPRFRTSTFNPNERLPKPVNAHLEGGDILVAREDILLVGIGPRSNSAGVDFLIEHFKQKKTVQHIIAQEVPLSPESFIHLDMVFTLLDENQCMVYAPLILQPNSYRTIHIEIDNGKVKRIHEVENLLTALRDLGMDLEPLYCGGRQDERNQEREQWHSGANFFAVAPGKVLGYERNVHTIEELNKHGYEVIRAKDFIKERVTVDNLKKFVITVEGTELARGGGGCRCMTMPICRE